MRNRRRNGSCQSWRPALSLHPQRMTVPVALATSTLARWRPVAGIGLGQGQFFRGLRPLGEARFDP